MRKALQLPLSHFKETLTIQDDPMETSVKFSTEKAFVEKHGLFGEIWQDVFLRAYLDKQTGRKSFQVYVANRHAAGDWQRPYQANYGKPLRSTEVRHVYRDVDCSYKRRGSCRYEEHVVFSVDESELRRVQNKATPEDFTKSAWLFRLKQRSGRNYDDGLFLPEILALLEAIDSYDPVPMQ